MNYQDHATKFVQLRPLKSKHAANVAEELHKIFFTFGAPQILQSDNGREFVAEIIEKLVSLWSWTRIVHGRPRHPQSQGSVERANGDVEDMIRAWMIGHQSTNWSKGCYEVQWQKNTSLHRVLKRTPYEAVLGPIKCGTQNTSLPDDILKSLRTEEDLIQALEEHAISTLLYVSETDESTIPSHETTSSAETVESAGSSDDPASLAAVTVDVIAGSSHDPASPVVTDDETAGSSQGATSSESVILSDKAVSCIEDTDDYCGCCQLKLHDANKCSTCEMLIHVHCGVYSSERQTIQCSLCIRGKRITETQKDCFKRQKIEALKMISDTAKKLVPLEVNDNVIVKVPKVDRGPLDLNNIIGIITEFKNDVYQVGTKDGLIKGWFSRSEIAKSGTEAIVIGDVPKQNLLSLREAAAKQSITGGQGFKKCNCKAAQTQCKTKRCACFKAQMLCNSRCHSSGVCSNK